MTLQHRDSSLAGGIDSTFIGDRMPQITQPGPRQEAESTTESVAATSGGGDGGAGDDRRSGLSPPASEGARTPTKVKELFESGGRVRALANQPPWRISHPCYCVLYKLRCL